MAVVSRNERKKRRCDALARLTSGMGVSQVTESLVRDYKITRRSANLDVQWASTKLVQNLNKHERTDLLAWLLYQTQQVFQKSVEWELNLEQRKLKIVITEIIEDESHVIPENKACPRSIFCPINNLNLS